MIHTIERKSDKTIVFTITFPWGDIQEKYAKVLDSVVKSAEIAGFRKGKAPRDIVEKNVDRAKVYEEVIKSIVPSAYEEAVKKEGVRPVVQPHITLDEAKEGTDWKVTMTTCETPEVKVGDYKSAVSEIKKSITGKKLWVPGENETKKEEKKPEMTVSHVLQAVLNVTTGDIPEILLEDEVNRMLSDLIERTRQLGLTVDQYLSSTGKTKETVRAEYQKQAKDTVLLELGLNAIADSEKITVGDDDMKKVIDTIESKEEKEAVSKDTYTLARVLRRQKTIEQLMHI